MAYVFNPTYIHQTVSATSKQVITAERWNELFNLLITQGDNTADAIKAFLTDLNTDGADNVGAVYNSVQMDLQSVLNLITAAIAARYTSTEVNTAITVAKNGCVTSVAYDATQGKFTINKGDGTNTVIDTTIEKIPASLALVVDGGVTYLVVTNTDGTTTRANVSSLVDSYAFNGSACVSVTASGSGNTRTFTFSIPDGSITNAKLAAEVMSTIIGYKDAAATSAAAAASSASTATTKATDAANSATAAATSAANASNSAGTATTKATSATNSATAAANSATAAAGSASATATSATNASNSATAAATSATNASNSATAAATSATSSANSASTSFSNANTATTKAEAAAASATAAATSATNAAGSATAASTSADNAASAATTAADAVTAHNINLLHKQAVDITQTGELANAEGSATTASGKYSHAEGVGTTASGYAAHAKGEFTVASGEAACAEGSATTASGNDSHAEGDTSKASGVDSHAEGERTIASGYAAHAEGYCTTALGVAAHAQNLQTIAQGYMQTAIGCGNIAQGSAPDSCVLSDYVFIIGNATYAWNTDTLGTRSNALTVTWAGDLWIAGNYHSADGSTGATGSFTSQDGKTVTVKNGIITAIV